MKFVVGVFVFAFAFHVEGAVVKEQRQHAVTSHLRKTEPLEVWPVGDGAYQQAEAVKQRATDPRKHCEEATAKGDYSDKKWDECFKLKGDYTDIRPIDADAQAKYDAAQAAREQARKDAWAKVQAAHQAKLDAAAAAAAARAEARAARRGDRS